MGDAERGRSRRGRRRLSHNPLPRNVVLVGLSGAGKTSLGRALAQRLGYGFCDVDTAIVARAGKPIPQIFVEDGQEVFRSHEAGVLESLVHLRRHVVAVGAGGVVGEDRWERVARLGLVVFRDVLLPVIAARLVADPQELEKRPLLADTLEEGNIHLRKELVLTKLRLQMETRRPWYERADLVDCESFAPVDMVAQGLAQKLREISYRG